MLGMNQTENLNGINDPFNNWPRLERPRSEERERRSRGRESVDRITRFASPSHYDHRIAPKSFLDSQQAYGRLLAPMYGRSTIPTPHTVDSFVQSSVTEMSSKFPPSSSLYSSIGNVNPGHFRSIPSDDSLTMLSENTSTLFQQSERSPIKGALPRNPSKLTSPEEMSAEKREFCQKSRSLEINRVNVKCNSESLSQLASVHPNQIATLSIRRRKSKTLYAPTIRPDIKVLASRPYTKTFINSGTMMHTRVLSLKSADDIATSPHPNGTTGPAFTTKDPKTEADWNSQQPVGYRVPPISRALTNSQSLLFNAAQVKPEESTDSGNGMRLFLEDGGIGGGSKHSEARITASVDNIDVQLKELSCDPKVLKKLDQLAYHLGFLHALPPLSRSESTVSPKADENDKSKGVCEDKSSPTNGNKSSTTQHCSRASKIFRNVVRRSSQTRASLSTETNEKSTAVVGSRTRSCTPDIRLCFMGCAGSGLCSLRRRTKSNPPEKLPEAATAETEYKLSSTAAAPFVDSGQNLTGNKMPTSKCVLTSDGAEEDPLESKAEFKAITPKFSQAVESALPPRPSIQTDGGFVSIESNQKNLQIPKHGVPAYINVAISAFGYGRKNNWWRVRNSPLVRRFQRTPTPHTPDPTVPAVKLRGSFSSSLAASTPSPLPVTASPSSQISDTAAIYGQQSTELLTGTNTSNDSPKPDRESLLDSFGRVSPLWSSSTFSERVPLKSEPVTDRHSCHFLDFNSGDLPSSTRTSSCSRCSHCCHRRQNFSEGCLRTRTWCERESIRSVPCLYTFTHQHSETENSSFVAGSPLRAPSLPAVWMHRVVEVADHSHVSLPEETYHQHLSRLRLNACQMEREVAFYAFVAEKDLAHRPHSCSQSTENLQAVAENAFAMMSLDIPRLYMICNRLGVDYTKANCVTEEISPELRSQLCTVQETYTSLESKFAHLSLKFAAVAEPSLLQHLQRRKMKSPPESSPVGKEERESELNKDSEGNTELEVGGKRLEKNLLTGNFERIFI
uniref:Uncharacterized protein n=1 Tax=Schistocephalus solidus TaxID=70667 RepID=A0A0V0JB90_SCHSO